MIFTLALTNDRIIYFCFLFVFFIICFTILKATNFEKCFKQGKTVEIKIAYFLICLIFSHVLASILIKLFI